MPSMAIYLTELTSLEDKAYTNINTKPQVIGSEFNGMAVFCMFDYFARRSLSPTYPDYASTQVW